MNMGLYILDGHTPVLIHDAVAWGLWFAESDAARRVDETQIDDVWVSTVFLGIDHNFGTLPNPALFETMVFGGEYDQDMARCATWEQAEQQHKDMVYKIVALTVSKTP